MNYNNLNKATSSVESRNQTDYNNTDFYNLDKKGTRILFVGNSITLHRRKDDIGWYGNWGMAASAPEKDYVHIMQEYFLSIDAESSFAVCNAADWEREYKNVDSVIDRFTAAREFSADIILIKLSANTPCKGFDEKLFYESFGKFVKFLNKDGNAKILISSDFYNHPAEDCLKKYALDNGFVFCKLSDLGEKEEMKAIGLFEHSGVANHPGDKGMEAIAERYIDCLKKNGIVKEK